LSGLAYGPSFFPSQYPAGGHGVGVVVVVVVVGVVVVVVVVVVIGQPIQKDKNRKRYNN